MALTPETLIKHELNGLRVEVVEAANPDLVGIAGRVVIETMRTLHVDRDAPGAHRERDGAAVEHEGSRVSQVPKRGTTFEFRIPRTDEAAGTVRGDTDLGDSPRRRGREAPGTASELASETAADRAGDGEGSGQSGACQGAAYVTVDGAQLLSRPALRTEDAGDSQWR